MKLSDLLGFGLCIIASAGCAIHRESARTSAVPTLPPPSVSSASADLLLISAVYGSGTNYSDVSYRVNHLIHQPGVEFFASPDWLKADPTPGWNKALIVVYEFKGQRRTFSCGEGGRISAEILIRSAK